MTLRRFEHGRGNCLEKAVRAVAWVLFLVAGCGRIETVPVTGTVTVDGGPPPAEGVLYFQPTQSASDYTARPGLAKFDTDGSYEAKSGTSVGLVPGHYEVGVECWKSPPNMEGKPVISHIPEAYRASSKSGFDVEVAPDAGIVRFDVEIVTNE